MEKYSQYRDKGSGIAPFFPIRREPSGIYLPLHVFYFIFRVPILLTVVIFYFFILSWLPIGSLGKKAGLWSILGVPGIWWTDLQIDGVKKGSLSKNKRHLPQPGSIIAASLTSPIDPIYLAAIFDPIFTVSYPNTRLLQPVSLRAAIFNALSFPKLFPTESAIPNLTSVAGLLKSHPDRTIVVFSECTTTNGRAILPLSPSILSAAPGSHVYPTSLRYTPSDITTPIPGAWLTCLWNLCARATHTIRMRIAEPVVILQPGEKAATSPPPKNSYSTNIFDSWDQEVVSKKLNTDLVNGHVENDQEVTPEEQKILDKVGEALARLGRVKRVALGVKEKADFIKSWNRKRR